MTPVLGAVSGDAPSPISDVKRAVNRSATQAKSNPVQYSPTPAPQMRERPVFLHQYFTKNKHTWFFDL